MRQSKLFTKVIKEIPKDENSFNAQILIRAGFIDKLAAGVYSLLPLGLRVHNKIINIIREEMDNIGGQEILMPALIPKENWESSGRWDNFDVLFKLSGEDKKEYALGATHEEVVTPLAKRFIFSYKDLPIFIYQIQTKFRNELRAKAGLIRGREFSMKDFYSFHTSEKDLNEYYKIVQKAYFRVYDRCGILDDTYLTYASGGSFTRYSHEFQTVCPAGEDTIHICPKCNIAVNEEIIEEQKICPACGNKKLKTAKAVEVGNIFKLGSRFSKAFNFYYVGKDGEKHEVAMGCYGIGLSRLMGTIVESHHDDKGIIWPEEIAPFHSHLILLADKKGKEKIIKAAEDLYYKLKQAEIEVIFDDREEISAGEKFAEADMIGCPYRLVISEKTLKNNSVEVKKRDREKTKLIPLNEIINYLHSN